MSPKRSGRRQAVRQLVCAAVVAGGVVVATLSMPSYGGTTATGADSYKRAYVAASRTSAAAAMGNKTIYFPDGSHVHLQGTSIKDGKVVYDAAIKNAISRSTADSAETADPTTAAQATANEKAAAAQRKQVSPTLRHVPVDQPRLSVPQNRYAMYNGCYALQNATTKRWLTTPTAPAFAATTMSAATPIYFKASDLGRYLLYSPAKTYLAANGSAVSYAARSGPSTNWFVTMPRKGLFAFGLGDGQRLAAGTGGKPTIAGTATLLRLHRTTGCAPFPEVTTNVVGNPIAGITPYQEVRGFIDAHTHGMAFEFLGGDVHCGRPWSPYGVETALKDCPDHYLTGGKGAVMEDFLSGDLDGHDPVGWPTFKDWPAPHSLTHEGTYYKWMERSWRAGQRILVNLLVENDQLCKIYPLKRNSCDDMDSIRLQASDMHKLERYVDAQHGGPGKGWYRIVTNPDQARKVINAGKLAVVMGIETSVPFGCTEQLGVPKCTAAQIDQQLTEVRKMGVTQMELVNKFDNALAGVAGDEGSTGELVNFANFLETGSFWKMQHCAVQDPEVHDKDQTFTPAIPAQDALFGAIVKFNLNLPALPLYGAPHHCNTQGLSNLGVDTIRGMAKRHMIFDPDHMSVKARKAALDTIDALHYSGVVSSHSWSTPDAYPRIYQEKGFITPYAGDSNGFVAKWQRHLTWANPKTYWGFGFGADINGLGAQGEPRPDAATNHPVTYPFTTLGGVKVYRQRSGQRVYDINKDGVAHYGLYPDWIQDLKMQAGPNIVKDMARGPEAYLQMWERAYGIKPNACSNPAYARSAAAFFALPKGISTWQTLERVGQPKRRLGQSFNYCTTSGMVKVSFTKAGRLSSVARF